MAQKNNIKLYRTLLAAGFFCVFAGLVLLLTLPQKNAESFLIYFCIITMFISALGVYISLIVQKAFPFFLGLNVFLVSATCAFLSVNTNSFSVEHYWPISMISLGITLIPSGYIRYKKMRTIYTIPACVLSALGIVFLLFSLDVIKIPLRTFMAYCWPLVLVICGIILIIYYLYGQKNKVKFFEEAEESDLEKSDE